MTNCLDFGLDFLFAHPGGSVFVSLVVERVQGLHQPTVVLRGGRRDFVHVERKPPLDDSSLEENADCGRNVHPEPFEQVAHLTKGNYVVRIESARTARTARILVK